MFAHLRSVAPPVSFRFSESTPSEVRQRYMKGNDQDAVVVVPKIGDDGWKTTPGIH